MCYKLKERVRESEIMSKRLGLQGANILVLPGQSVLPIPERIELGIAAVGNICHKICGKQRNLFSAA
jgi:hypothetical protein